MSTIDRVVDAHGRLIVEAHRLVATQPGAHPALELALRELRDAEHAKALRKAELHSAIRSVEPDRIREGGA